MAVLDYLRKLKRSLELGFAGHFLHDLSLFSHVQAYQGTLRYTVT